MLSYKDYSYEITSGIEINCTQNKQKVRGGQRENVTYILFKLVNSIFVHIYMPIKLILIVISISSVSFQKRNVKKCISPFYAYSLIHIIHQTNVPIVMCADLSYLSF